MPIPDWYYPSGNWSGDFPYFPNDGSGGYYYVYSKEVTGGISNKYSEMFANIVLPTNFNQVPSGNTNPNHNRNAYICFGLHDGTNYVDIGLQNKNGMWRPYFYDSKVDPTYVNPVSFDHHHSQAFDTNNLNQTCCISTYGATNAIMVVKPVDSNHIKLYIQFQNNGQNVAHAFDQNVTITARTGGISAWKRYFRFASLVPYAQGCGVDTDSTYMLGGRFKNVQVYNSTTSSYNTWNIDTSTITQIAWAEDVPKCQVSILHANTNGMTGESFRIDHWA